MPQPNTVFPGNSCLTAIKRYKNIQLVFLTIKDYINKFTEYLTGESREDRYEYSAHGSPYVPLGRAVKETVRDGAIGAAIGAGIGYAAGGEVGAVFGGSVGGGLGSAARLAEIGQPWPSGVSFE